MLKPMLGLLLLSILTAMGPMSPVDGCKRAGRVLFDWRYPAIRDMRTSVALIPQRGWYRAPDSLSVPVGGRETLRDVAQFDATFQNPQAADAASIERGALKYARVCRPCHGTALDGQGPVWQSQKFLVPIPSLLTATARGRSDGYIYRYIRFGGAVMPSYGAQVSAPEAHDLVNYVRDEQRKNPQ
jgi:S-disulfanyl-L-cysteine oxidoreductase SoxD